MRHLPLSIRAHAGSSLTAFLLYIGLSIAAPQPAVGQPSGDLTLSAVEPAFLLKELSTAGSFGFATLRENTNGSAQQAEPTFGRALLGSAAGGLITGAVTAGTLAFTGWGLTGQSRTGAVTGAWIGGIPGVAYGSGMGAKLALAGTDREPGFIASLLGGLASAGVGIVVWKQVAGDIAPEDYDARWRRGVAAGFAVESVLTALLAYGL